MSVWQAQQRLKARNLSTVTWLGTERCINSLDSPMDTTSHYVSIELVHTLRFRFFLQKVRLTMLCVCLCSRGDFCRRYARILSLPPPRLGLRQPLQRALCFSSRLLVLLPKRCVPLWHAHPSCLYPACRHPHGVSVHARHPPQVPHVPPDQWLHCLAALPG